MNAPFAPGACDDTGAAIARRAALLGDDLMTRVVPYWAATLDRRYGGFLLADSETSRGRLAERMHWRLRRWLGRGWGGTQASPGEKHIVGQARVIHALALAHRLGFDPAGAGLTAALAGLAFLRAHLLDRCHGGFVWSASRSGRVLRPEKLLYAHAFAVLALTELGRAARRPDLLAEALEVLRLVHERLHDDAHGGWREHATADFRDLGAGAPAAGGLIDRPGGKSANAHLHLLEALAELTLATGDSGVRAALEEALEVCARFFPAELAVPRECLGADWTPLADAAPHRVGHLLEYAWLVARAHRALGRPAPVAVTVAAVDHALLDFDWELGGFVSQTPHGRCEKDWWVQAEGVVALTASVRLGGRHEHLRALALLLEWIVGGQRGSRGVWVAATDRAGRVTNPTLAGTWKAGYHEVRAAAVVARVFGAAR